MEAIRLKGDAAIFRVANFEPVEEKAVGTERVMRRFYTFKTMRGRKDLRAKLPGRFIDDAPNIGQCGVVKPIFDFIYQNHAIRHRGYG